MSVIAKYKKKITENMAIKIKRISSEKMQLKIKGPPVKKIIIYTYSHVINEHRLKMRQRYRCGLVK